MVRHQWVRSSWIESARRQGGAPPRGAGLPTVHHAPRDGWGEWDLRRLALDGVSSVSPRAPPAEERLGCEVMTFACPIGNTAIVRPWLLRVHTQIRLTAFTTRCGETI